MDPLPGKALAASGDAFGLSPKNDSPMVPTKSGSGDAAPLGPYRPSESEDRLEKIGFHSIWCL